MAHVSRGMRLSYSRRRRRFAKAAAFPRWITILFMLILGLILWLGVLADPAGHLKTPGGGSILYVLAVIGVAAFLAYADRNEESSPKDRKSKPRYKGRRNAAAR